MDRQLNDPDLSAIELEVIARVQAALQLPMPDRARWFETVAFGTLEANREQAARDWKKLVAQCAKTERRAA